MLYLAWGDVTGWVPQGGANLGTKRTLPAGKMKEISERLKEYQIQALLIIGGFEVKYLVVIYSFYVTENICRPTKLDCSLQKLEINMMLLKFL